MGLYPKESRRALPSGSCQPLRTAKSAYYEIRVRGLPSETKLGAFPDLRAKAEGAETVLAGELPDQAALFGVLAQVGTLGLELLEVRQKEGWP